MLRPLNNRVVIRPDEKEKETASGILLPDSQVEKPSTGTILVGNDVVQEGDKVLFSRFGFDEITHEGESLYVVSTSCLLAIL